ncbi:MAG: S-layer homology domain-containing protein [Anaerolineales bacterium]|nr:S-layer homology domain-containing protein [Anaerolineales bacterium]
MDVAIGAYYAEPVQLAYGWGVADGTSDTTFSPDQPATRGEYIKMLYRALSIVQ